MNRLLFFVFSITLITNVSAEDLTDIQISSPVMDKATISNEAIEEIDTRNAVDGGDLLKNINGVNTIRRGGHGLEAVIRGQNDQRLNTFLDGAMVYGACSAKMDPASTYANVNNYDSVTVIKGTQSVLFGAGGPGGIVSFKRVTNPVTNPEFRFGQNFNTNAGAYTTSGNIVFPLSSKSYLRLNGSSTNAGNYETGSGIKPLTEYVTTDYTIILGTMLTDGSKLEVNYSNNRQDQVGYPGLMMDIAYSYTDMYTLKYHRVTSIGIFSKMNVELFNTDIDHLMDNTTLRGTTGNGSMFTPSSSDTYGGRIIGTIGNDIRAGIDYEHNTKNAEQNMTMMGSNVFMMHLWPDVETEKLGLFFEKDMGNVSYGLRYDQVELEPHKQTVDNGMMATQISPNALYTSVYDGTVTASKKDFDNISGFIRMNKELSHGDSYVSFSVNERAPDTTELFNAKNSSTNMMKHVGNPNLSSERHMTLEAGYEGMFMGNHIIGSIYYNDVDDYVTTYRQNDNAMMARLYKNVDATLYGYELTAHRIIAGIDTTLNLNYTRGEDDTQNRALPQIMPLAGDLTFELKSAKTNYGLRINFADTQDSFDSKVLDIGETAGYTVYDIFAGFEPTPNLRFTVGMSNITDKRYATHLNTTNTLDASADRTDEPGRSLFGSINYEF
ncbi:TonB-dependent receptor [Gammaproteobacteria bacterium]|nr:TonB-dependent receptor [Gammaproteobacteria bacterium]